MRQDVGIRTHDVSTAARSVTYMSIETGVGMRTLVFVLHLDNLPAQARAVLVFFFYLTFLCTVHWDDLPSQPYLIAKLL